MVLRLLFPLGLLALLGLLFIVLIHVINPKYQDKIISSTYIWKKALRIKKKTLPIDKFSNLLLFFAQCLILALCAMALSSPSLFEEQALKNDLERILVVEASASMRAKRLDEDGETRFERALDEVRLSMNEVLMEKDGYLTIIIASDEPYFLVSGADDGDYSDVVKELDALTCPLCAPDMERAVNMAEERMLQNPASEVFVYSGTEYGFTGNAVTQVNLSDFDREWNIGILGCEVAVEENEFVFHAEIGAYGKIAREETLIVDIYGAKNGEESEHDILGLKVPLNFIVNTEAPGMELKQNISIRATDTLIGGHEDDYFSSYERVELSFQGLHDSIEEDDKLTVYGGQRDVIKVQYYSANPNTFYYLVFNILRDFMKTERDIIFEQVIGEEPKIEGYDIYLFEHTVPDVVVKEGLPQDGVVFLLNPDKDEEDLEGLGFSLGEEVAPGTMYYLSQGSKGHPLTQNMDPTRIGVSRYYQFQEFDETFVPVLYCDKDPVVLAKNVQGTKLVVMPFSVNYSNFSVTYDFVIFLYNTIEYYLPLTLEKTSFTLGETGNIHCKGADITVSSEGGQENTLNTFPSEFTFEELGTYTFQTHFFGEKESEIRKAFVKIPTEASAIFSLSDVRAVIDKVDVYGELRQDIFVYFAAAVVAFLFIEWYLQFRSDFY